jgi:hypothetical protein
MSFSISLGWNCSSAMWAVENGIRKTKDAGYKTCPFDIMGSNFDGLIECLKTDFKDFTNPNFLSIVDTTGIVFEHPVYKSGELLLVHTKYKFIFNHESPTHGDLYLHEGWKGGIFHYCNDNFKEFIIRYNQRIANFRNYIQMALNEDKILVFIIKTHPENIPILKSTIENVYPRLKFEILCNDVKLDCQYNIFIGNMEFMESDFYGLRNANITIV